MRGVLEEWLLEVEAHDVSTKGSRIELARSNAQAFSMSKSEAAACLPSDIAEFIESAWRTYVAKLSGSRLSLWFYAWVDEQAGQLRCSATTCRSREDLPFGRVTDVTQDAESVAQEFLSCSTLEGIPFSDLRENSEEGDAPEPSLPPLKVFARVI